MPHYQLYNAALTTDLQLANLRPRTNLATGWPLRVTLAGDQPCPEDWVAGAWSDYPTRTPIPELLVWCAPAPLTVAPGLALRLGYCNDAYDAFFTIHAGHKAIWVTWQPHTLSANETYALVCRLLVGPVVPFVLRLAGQLALHGAVVSTPLGAIAFLGQGGAGKSTLAAACAQHGWPTLADDVVVLTHTDGDWWSHPGPPSRHLWPKTLAGLDEDATRHPLVHPGTTKRHVDFRETCVEQRPDWFAFAQQPQPLRACFALAPYVAGATAVQLQRQLPIHALQTLLRHRYGLIETPAERRRAEIAQCSALLAQVEVYTTVRPDHPTAYLQLIDQIEQMQRGQAA